MKYKIAITFLFFISSWSAHGQFGVNLMYVSPTTSPDWDVINNDEAIQAAGYGLSIDYWWRLKNYRIEWLGEVGYTLGDQNIESVDLSWNQWHGLVNTNFYIFDFEGDCNCPTWGKDGTLFEKGFFVQVGIGGGLFSVKNQTESLETSGQSAALLAHVGAGVDFGIAEYLTFTPWVRFAYRSGTTWSGLDNAIQPAEEADLLDSSSTGWVFGIRTGYRLDYKRR